MEALSTFNTLFNNKQGALGTKLTLEEEKKYQIWKSKLPTNLQYEGNYDLKGFWKENPNFNLSDPKQHLTDKYKLPNHTTFSNESIYFNPNTKKYAGRWAETDSSWNYIPYNTKFKKQIIEKKDIPQNINTYKSLFSGTPIFPNLAKTGGQ